MNSDAAAETADALRILSMISLDDRAHHLEPGAIGAQATRGIRSVVQNPGANQVADGIVFDVNTAAFSRVVAQTETRDRVTRNFRVFDEQQRRTIGGPKNPGYSRIPPAANLPDFR